jgi:hypothetical protein
MSIPPFTLARWGEHTKGSPLNVSVSLGVDKPLMILQKIHLDINTQLVDCWDTHEARDVILPTE